MNIYIIIITGYQIYLFPLYEYLHNYYYTYSVSDITNTYIQALGCASNTFTNKKKKKKKITPYRLQEKKVDSIAVA